MIPAARLPRRTVLAAGLLAPFAAAVPAEALAASRHEIDADANKALERLYRDEPKTRELGARAVGILIFPKITKAGLIFGGESGDGVLRENSRSVAYYTISGGSFGLQAGAQVFGYALFFMNPSALDYLHKQKGWTVGTGPSFVVADKGFAKTLNTATLTKDVYAVPFDQRGLMGGIGIQGSKIGRIEPGP